MSTLPAPDREPRTRQQLRSQLFDLAPVGLCLMAAGQPQLINRRLARMLGGDGHETQLSPAELLRRWPALWPQFRHMGDEHRVVSIDRPGLAPFNGRAFSRPLSALGEDQEIVTLVNEAQLNWMSFSSDWQARMLALTESMSHTGSAELDLDRGQAVVSRGMATLVGRPELDGAQKAWRLLRWVPQEERGYVASIWAAAIDDEPFEFQHRLQTADGQRLEILHRGMVEVTPDGRRRGYMTLQNITLQRETEQRIQELANHDEVTGLPNRKQLLDRIDAAVHAASWDPRAFALLSIQIDPIDQLSQAMGYGAGDALAMAVAARLSALVGPDSLVARVGSGEFALLLGEAESATPEALQRTARQVVGALARPERLGCAEIVPLAQIGVASFPSDAQSASQLLEAAQTARLGVQGTSDQVAFFTPEITAKAMRRLAIESGLRHAVEREELRLQFQLQIDLSSGSAVGAEVLLAWHSEALGEVPPEEFLPVARQTGLIVALGDWQRDSVCELLQRWLRQGVRPLRLALNHSVLQLQQPDLVPKIQRSLLEHGVPSTLLGLEIAEQVLMNGSPDVARKLAELRALGLEIALDDFGTGYSNLNQLRHLPVDVLKVHRSCVPDVTAASGAVSLTRAIINLAHSLQMKVLAEGVETEGQLTLLMANGCDRLQGTAFSPVVDQATLEAQLSTELPRLPERFLRRQRERTLLLVDDEPNIVAALKRLFRRDGYRIVTAASGLEGLQRMAEYEVDVVLSDQRMPGMTGVEFLRRAKELYPDTVRMVLSGYTELQSITDAVNEGAIYRFLTKPWDDERLRVHVQEGFHQKGLADENRRLALEVRGANEELAVLNGRLERVLSTQQAQLGLEASRATAARDMLDLLPVPAMGIDPAGLVVMANLAAQQCWGAERLLLGQCAASVLPAELAPLWAQPGEQSLDFDWSGRRWRARTRPFGASAPQGHLLVLNELA
ncbi:EAL domain-containing protein [Curvibacter sp. RS43]|uniref:EAL domain-containing protein n=1 Tax=Curvibacter microcysteis TaxID=3026419 RepID=A0ABT5MLH7_9BURK|nr:MULTISPECIES: EAL domain-containing protein [unclassified Curvibacter]MDD0810969.1 EAL domain-containing protein [Curvibacter sp. RS43]MDD0816075.1 EAL domain-containing protein [Curvibacter sp. HBC28]